MDCESHARGGPSCDQYSRRPTPRKGDKTGGKGGQDQDGVAYGWKSQLQRSVPARKNLLEGKIEKGAWVEEFPCPDGSKVLGKIFVFEQGAVSLDIPTTHMVGLLSTKQTKRASQPKKEKQAPHSKLAVRQRSHAPLLLPGA